MIQGPHRVVQVGLTGRCAGGEGGNAVRSSEAKQWLVDGHRTFVKSGGAKWAAQEIQMGFGEAIEA
jgi:hypothetical protein